MRKGLGRAIESAGPSALDRQQPEHTNLSGA